MPTVALVLALPYWAFLIPSFAAVISDDPDAGTVEDRAAIRAVKEVRDRQVAICFFVVMPMSNLRIFTFAGCAAGRFDYLLRPQAFFQSIRRSFSKRALKPLLTPGFPLTGIGVPIDLA